MAFSNPYSNIVKTPSLPFCSPIPGGLTYGKQIQIQGIVQSHPEADGFSINLCCGPKMDPDCALHINPRFYQQCIVRNGMQGGFWGNEEREGGLPIVKGKLFEVIILTAQSGYQIAVNGRHFTEFKHRLPMHKVQYLLIDGRYMTINFIKYEGGDASGQVSMGMAHGFGPEPGFPPPPYTPGGFVTPQFSNKSNVFYNPPVPLSQLIPGRMNPKRVIYISGVPHPDAKRFSINLKGGPTNTDTIFHFDVRLYWGSDRNIVVRNTCSSGIWGPEERTVSHFPFMPNANFDMIIMATAQSFKVAVNNAHYIEYAHRLPLKSINTLSIEGDVRISSLSFQPSAR